MFALSALLAVSMGAVATERDVVKSAVPVIQDGRFTVHAPAGQGDIPVHISRNWAIPQPDVTRAIIIIHGWPRRDLGADEYIAKKTGTVASHAIFITPQFLINADITAHRLPDDMLRWTQDGWRDGYDAQAPAAVSSFEVIDAIFQKLADRAVFPNLQTVVLAGHSAGGQFVQRYAAIGKGEHFLSAANIHARYVVANPSSYLYFDDRRMQADGSFSHVNASRCDSFASWNYGFSSKTPRYLQPPFVIKELEKTYLSRDVAYLLGTADDDPKGDAVDRSCGAETQGANRYSRGLAYAGYIQLASSGKSGHLLLEVPGVSHHSYLMYSSACGLSALFDTAACDKKR
ncbi:MAG: alpha/beta hydrolase [Pseudomonadota bacterium]